MPKTSKFGISRTDYFKNLITRIATPVSFSHAVFHPPGVLKDYLRELPEPLFTKCLYQMLCDALSVCLPDDPEGNAKLMFSILDCLPKINRVRTMFKCGQEGP